MDGLVDAPLRDTRQSPREAPRGGGRDNNGERLQLIRELRAEWPCTVTEE